MFGRKNKKKKEKRKFLTHPDFGELKYSVGWELSETVKIALWNRTYDVRCSFIAKEDEDVTPNQEEAYKKIPQALMEQRESMEQIILQFQSYLFDVDEETEPGDRFIPHDIDISRGGVCVLFFEDTAEGVPYGYDTNTGFAVCFLPKLIYGPTEDFSDCLREDRPIEDFLQNQ